MFMGTGSLHRMVWFCLGFPAWAVFADQITLTNGDRISGNIVKYDGKVLVLKSDLAGEITVPWTGVADIVSLNPLSVGITGGQVVVGTVRGAGGSVSVATRDAGTITASRDSIQFIRSQAEQAAYEAQVERYRNPRLTDLWTGFLDLGLAESRGNARTENVSLTANAARATSRDKIAAYFTSIYSKGTVENNGSALTANAKRGGLSYNLNFSKKWFAFGSVDLESDQFQSLDLRFVPAGGVGYHLMDSETTSLDLQAGAALNREFFTTGLSRTHGEAVLGEVFQQKFSKTTLLQEKFFYYPGVSDSRHRINFDTSLVTAIRKWLSWQLTVSDRYLSDPVPGRKNNDVLFTTGARLTFAK